MERKKNKIYRYLWIVGLLIILIIWLGGKRTGGTLYLFTAIGVALIVLGIIIPRISK